MNVHPPLGINLGMMSHALLGGGSIPSWVVNPTNPPDLAVDFSNNRAWTKATKAQTTSASLLTVSRASSGTVNDSLGNWTSVASNLPRLSDLGLLVEEARTNAIRNNSMAGAVVMADGVELLTNGNFAVQGSGWTTGTAGAGSVVFATGSATIVGDGATNGNYISQQISGLVPGRNYVVIYQSASNNAGINILVGTSAGNGSITGSTATNPTGTNASTPDRTSFTAPAGGSVWVSFARFTASAAIVTGFSVQDGERVENGGFTSNPINAAQNTVQNGWQWTNNVGTGTVTYVGGNSVSLLGDGTHSAQIDVAIPTVAGFTYTISLDVSGTAVQVQAGNTAYNAALLSVASGTGTGLKFQFTATASTTHINLAKSASATTTIANVSVQSAGALPTNWSHGGGTAAGLRWNVVAVGTTNGVNTIDIDYVGTTTGVGWNLNTEASAIITSSYGQTWAISGFDALVAGSLTNVSAIALIASDQGGSQGTAVTSGNFAPTSTFTRRTGSGTLTSSGNTTLRPSYVFTVSNTSAIDFTIRIGWPQLENNSINSTVASAAVAAGGSGGTTGTGVYSIGGGTGTGATLNITVSGGAITAINSVASAGSYSVFPSSPAALTYVSGTATGVTGATVTLTPTNNSALAFATSPIVTTSAAATRASDVVTLTSPPTFGSAYTFFAQATPQAPVGYTSQWPMMFALSGAERFGVRRVTGTSNVQSVSTTGSVDTISDSGVVWAQSTSGKAAFAGAAADQDAAFNGTLLPAKTATMPTTPTSVSLGLGLSTQQINGFVSQAAIWASQRVPNAQLQSMTT